jgi:hypothetical protein
MQNYTNIAVTVNGTTYYATQASFSVSTSLEPVYSLGNAGKVAQNPTGPIKGTFSLDYNIASDGIKGIFDNIVANMGTAVTPIGVALGGQTFSKAYLTSHGANGQANQLATAKASFDLYFDSPSQAIAFGSAGSGGASSGGNVALGHGAASSTSGGGITNGTSFAYDAQIQYDFVFKIGSITPQSVFVSRASRKITLEGYELSANISMCGDTATATASVSSLCGSGGGGVSYSAAGQITQAEGSVSAGQVGRGKVTVTQFI